MTASHRDTEHRVRQALQYQAANTPICPDLDGLTDADGRPAAPLGPGGRSRRSPAWKRPVVALVAVLMLGGGAAFGSGLFDPDPAQVSAILDLNAPMYPEGRLPTLLSTSVVWCAYENGVVSGTAWHELAIDEEMTRDHLVEACAAPDPIEFQDLDVPSVDVVTLCEAIVPADEAQRRLEAAATPIIEGEFTHDRPAFPFVLGWDADCSQTSLDTDPRVELRPLTTLAPMNRAREVEIGLQAAAIAECLTLDRVTELASEARSGLDGDWLVIDGTVHVGGHDSVACWSGVRVDPVYGTLDIGGWGG